MGIPKEVEISEGYEKPPDRVFMHLILDSQTFYIGYDPSETACFKGPIRRVLFDPNASNPGVA